MVAFDYAASSSGVQIMPEIGVRLPLHATSQGKIALASLSPKAAERLLLRRGMQPYTPHTTVDLGAMLRELPPPSVNRAMP